MLKIHFLEYPDITLNVGVQTAFYSGEKCKSLCLSPFERMLQQTFTIELARGLRQIDRRLNSNMSEFNHENYMPSIGLYFFEMIFVLSIIPRCLTDSDIGITP